MAYERNSVPEGEFDRRWMDQELRSIGDETVLIEERLTSIENSLIVEYWREVGSAGEPAFENGWVNFDSGWDTAAFYKDSFGRVHIKGLVKSGTANLDIFILPVGYRPALKLAFATVDNLTAIRLQVQEDGVVKTSGATTNTATGLNISFRV